RSMPALLVSLAAFVVIIAGTWVGAHLRTVLPKHHLDAETRDAVRIGVGLIATMSALVLGLLLATAKSSFDTKSDEIRTSAAKIILLDRTFREYGSETNELRALLRDTIERRVDHKWIDLRSLTVMEPSTTTDPLPMERLQEKLRAMSPGTPGQRLAHARALQLGEDLAQTRWLLVEQLGGTIPLPFLVLLVLWVALIFASLGLFAPRNGTFYTVIVVCALSVASALFLIIEMDRPFGGVLRISDAPLRTALQYLQR
ncbi:MAG: DUF4239 domain-containing protein, partial [Casimicrobiaceae bacterium]